MEYEPGFGIIPADDLSETEVIEYKCIVPFLHGVKLLGKGDEVPYVFTLHQRTEQGIIPGKITEPDLFFAIEHRTETHIIAAVVAGHHIP